MSQAAALPDVIRDFERVDAGVVVGEAGGVTVIEREKAAAMLPMAAQKDAYVKMGVGAARNALAVLHG
jgi:hypothetical protein